MFCWRVVELDTGKKQEKLAHKIKDALENSGLNTPEAIGVVECMKFYFLCHASRNAQGHSAKAIIEGLEDAIKDIKSETKKDEGVS